MPVSDYGLETENCGLELDQLEQSKPRPTFVDSSRSNLQSVISNP